MKKRTKMKSIKEYFAVGVFTSVLVIATYMLISAIS